MVTAVDPDVLLAGVRAGRPRAVGRVISLVESASPLVPALVAALAPDTGRALVVGLTGAPGVGKSSAVGALVTRLRVRGQRVGVLAVDPTSPFSGGAVLGDRVRMQEHALDTGVHIRSMATRGELGGLAVAVPAALRVLDAAGCDTTLVETVGVGQSEVAVAATADVTLVLLAPGAGDGVQLAKAGVLEVADVLVVTKADAGGADSLARELRAMVAHGHHEPGEWVPPVVLLSSVRSGVGPSEEASGVDEVLAAVTAFAEHQRRTGGWTVRRARRARGEVEQLVLAEVRASAPGGAGELDRLAREVAAGRLDPYAAARALLATR
jgi:LAO/AO transport system kinase